MVTGIDLLRRARTAVNRRLPPPSKVLPNLITGKGYLPKGTRIGIVPLAPVGAAGAAGGAAVRFGGRLASGARTLLARATVNPFAGMTARGALLKAGSKALGVTAGIEAFQLGRSRVTGEPFNPVPSLKTIAGATLNPIAFLAGAGFGGVETFGDQAINYAKQTQQLQPINIQDILPQFQSLPDFNFNFPSLGSPPSTGNIVGGALPTSINVTGLPSEQSSLMPYLLALLGVGVAGYAVGRKRRKKKKSKKRKRR